MMTAQLQLLVIYLCINLWTIIPTLRHCSKNENNKTIRLLWMMAIAIFNLPGVMLYLLNQKKSNMNLSIVEVDFKLNKHLIFVGLMIAYEIISLPLVINNSQNIILIVCIVVTLILAFVNHYVIAGNKSVFYLIMPFIQVVGIIVVDLLATSNEFKIIILIVVVSILNEYAIDYSKRFAWLPLLLYMGVSALFYLIVEGKSYGFVGIHIIKNSITYTLVVGAFYIGRKQLLLNQQLHDMTWELRENNRQLEEISIIKERNRIAREIHDTLGHTLTGAIIQLEAAKKLIHIDHDKTLEAIEKTQKITRDGFLDVKRAIQALRPILIEEGNLKDSLEALFEKIENDFHVRINHSIYPDTINEESIKVSLYRIIQESITNSIRHGGATRIDIGLNKRDNSLELFINDNGKGCYHVQESYGLKGIRERVSACHGQIRILSNPNQGFQIQISMPIY